MIKEIKTKNTEKIQMGKKSRAAGQRFERKVREDLEKRKWIVSKWMNNVKDGKLVQSKAKFRGNKIPMAIGTGFPDFLVFRRRTETKGVVNYEIIGVESKINKYLDKKERKNCEWLLDNKIFDKIFVAYKVKKKNRVKVLYKKFKKSTKK